jgi:glucokinase
VIAIVDAPVVLGGGLAAARELFLPSFLEELRRPLTGRLYGGTRRLIQEVFDLDTDAEREAFLAIDSTPCSLPGSGAAFSWRSRPALGVGVTRLGTSQAVALGAYSVACQGLM